MNEESYPQSDHDAIITLISEVRQVRTDIKDLKDGTTTTVADHENRIRRIEFWGALLLGGLYVINTILGLYVIYTSSHH